MSPVSGMHESNPQRPLEVWLLTGFLGSGKTTLLRQLAERSAPGELALIINEFAEVGIDQHLIRADADGVLLLEGGCACCVIKDDLVEGLYRLLARVRDGALPGLRRVLIETSGLADPNPIVHALRADHRLREFFAPAVVLAVVDATRAVEQLDAFSEVASQIAAADHLLLSKLDLALPQSVAMLEQQLAQLNPLAVQHRVDHGRIADLASGEPWSLPSLKHVNPAYRRINEAVRHTDGMAAQVIECRGPVNWPAFCDWLQALCLACGRDLMRAKGIVHATGEAGPRLVNAVNFSIYPPEILPREHGATDDVTRLVLIGRNLDASRLRRTFDAALRS